MVSVTDTEAALLRRHFRFRIDGREDPRPSRSTYAPVENWDGPLGSYSEPFDSEADALVDALMRWEFGFCPDEREELAHLA